LADFNAIIATNPTNADTLAGLGAAMTQLKQYERAIELCERAAQVDFKNVTAHVCLGYARTNQGLLQKAEEDFERALQWNNTSAAAHIGRGYLRKRLGNFDGATADFQRALEIDRRSPDALRHLISIHTDRGYLDKALLAFEEASNIHRNDAANFYLRSFIWALKGDPSRARRDIDQAFTLIGTPDSDSYLARAAMNYFLGDTPKAVADAREAIKLNGENGQAHRLLARSLIKQGDLRGAETSLQRAQQLLPNDWNVIRTLGLLELARNNHQKAKDYFERSNDLNPAFNEGFVGLGRAYEGLKLNDLARAEYQRALTKLDYDNDGREARAEAQRRIAALSAPAPAAKTTPVGPLAKGDDPTARPGGGPSPTATGPTLSPGAGGTDAGGSKSASGANPQPPRKVETAADQSLMCRLLGGWLGNARDYTGVKIDIGCGPGR
jgi:tetratricopeptide (TPR) repeat protein